MSIERLFDLLQYPLALNKQSIVTLIIFGDKISKVNLIFMSLAIILFEVGVPGYVFYYII
jgi:hypothetical protein